MRIVLERTLLAGDVGEQRCAICRLKFWLGAATAFAVSDTDTLLGETCPSCIERGAEHMAAELQSRARWSRWVAEMDEVLAEEGFDELPTVAEYRMLETVYGTARYRDGEEAEAALARGGPGLLNEDE
jgi:hypothetical protein